MSPLQAEPEFDKQELAHVLMAARSEILTLRQQVNRLAPMAEAYEVIRAGLLGLPKSQVYGVDYVPEITRLVERLLDKGEKENSENER